MSNKSIYLYCDSCKKEHIELAKTATFLDLFKEGWYLFSVAGHTLAATICPDCNGNITEAKIADHIPPTEWQPIHEIQNLDEHAQQGTTLQEKQRTCNQCGEPAIAINSLGIGIDDMLYINMVCESHHIWTIAIQPPQTYERTTSIRIH